MLKENTEAVGQAAQAEPVQRPGIAPRAFALTALVTTAGCLLYLGVAVFRLFADSWIAPIELSPESDAVLQLDLQLTRQRAEIAQVEAERARIDAEVAAIDSGVERLASLQDRSKALFEYGAEAADEQARTMHRSLQELRREREVIDRLLGRAERELERARAHFEAGVIQRRDLEAHEQTLDTLTLRRSENARALEAGTLQHEQAARSATAFRKSIDSLRGTSEFDARMPEIVKRHEEDVRLELEILRLRAERRGLVAMRNVADRSARELREVMQGIENRPLYRATLKRMDVAFVPYQQLGGVHTDAKVVACVAGIFFCRVVGRVKEVLEGEVVTQDPWGSLARGRYAVLHLWDSDAVHERILRVR